MSERIDIQHVMELLGLEIYGVSGGWAHIRCPLHDERRPSFGIDLETGRWLCQSNCGTGSLVKLVSLLKSLSLSDAFQWLIRSPAIVKAISREELLSALETVPVPVPVQQVEYNGKRIPRFMLERGFTVKELVHWGVGVDPETRAAVVPAEKWLIRRNVAGVEPRYRYDPEMPKAKMLFGEWFVEGDSVIVVEGPLDCIWMHQCGFRNTVAILGASISQAQARKLGKYSDVTLALDNDTAGKVGMQLITDKLLRKLYVMEVPQKDPQACTPEELYGAYENRVDAIRWSLGLVRVVSSVDKKIQDDVPNISTRLKEFLSR